MLDTIIPALSRLNTHARAWGFGKEAIYAYKTFVACAYAEDARPVQVQVRCHHCSGTGTYHDRDGEDRGRCYRCTKGVVTLRFIESTIGDCRWHHPVNAGGEAVLDCVWDITSKRTEDEYRTMIAVLRDGTERPIVYAQANGWGPKMPGAEKLPTDEACRLLNLVEHELPNIRPGERTIYACWPREKALREMTRYRIDLDHDRTEACCMCGTSNTPAYSCGGACSKWRGGWADFSRIMCKTCHGTAAPYRWPTEPAPETLTPNVLAWLAHPERQRQRVVEHEYHD